MYRSGDEGEAMSSRAAGVAQVVLGTAATLALLYYLRVILVPLVIAFVLAVLVNALVEFIRQRWSAAPSWVVATLTGLLVIGAAAAAVFALAQGGVRIVAQGPALIARLDVLSVELGGLLHLRRELHIAAIIGSVSVPQFARYVLSELQGIGTNLLLVIVYFGFMLAGRQRLSRKMDNAAGSSTRAETFRAALKRIAAQIQTYLWVQTITGSILTLSSVAVMAAVGLHNVAFWAVIFFLLTFIPQIGVTVGSIAPSLFALIQFSTVWQAITIFAVIQVVATIVGNLIYPRLQAETQNMDPLVALVSLSFWTLLWGLPGSFLAVPLTLMLMIIFAQFSGTMWIAALLSNDGKPMLRKKPSQRLPAKD